MSFSNGEPLADSTSRDAAVPIMGNVDLGKCPDGCFRPVGLAWDGRGRLFMSSDATGEVWMITRVDGNATSEVGSNATGTIPSTTGSGAPAESSRSAGSLAGVSGLLALGAVLAFLL